MCGVILDAPDIFVGRSIIDAIVHVIAYVPWWEIVAKIIIRDLVNLLVVVVIGFMSLTTPMSALTMGVMIGVMIA
jgi:hypothetical protein